MAQIFFRGRAVEARPPMKERSSRPPSRGFQGPGSPSSSKGSAILAPPRLSSEGTASPTSLSESLEDSVELGGSYRGLRSLRARPPEARPASKRSARNGEAVPGLEGSILPVLASKGGRSFVETQPEPELAFGKCLSFAADSLDDVAAAIRADAGQVDWMEDCWRPVLHQTPIPECKPLLTRSLRSWLEVYNRWQALGDWTPGHAPSSVDAYQFQEVLATPMVKVLEWVRLLDPVAYAKIQQLRSAADYQRVKVSMPAFFTAAIFLSSTISKKQKIRFLLGVFDENDNCTLELTEFISMLCAFFHGIAFAFNLRLSRDARAKSLGQFLFQRILEAAKMERPGPNKAAEGRDSVPFAFIEDWLLGLTGDPFSSPFALLLERFSVRGLEEDPEVFEDESRRFRLSHTSPVSAPMETETSLDSSFLRRSQLRIVRDLFNRCMDVRHFSISHWEAEQMVGTEIELDLWINKLSRALEELQTLWQDGAKIGLGLFLKRLCPQALPRHLRMFQSWLKELNQLEELRDQVELSRQRLASFRQFVVLPVLPNRIREELLQNFEERMGISEDTYVAKHCPENYRPNFGNPLVEKMVDSFLSATLARQEEHREQKEALFAPSGASQRKATRSFLKPEVSAESLSQWNEAWDVLDKDGLGTLTEAQLVSSHLLPLEICMYMCAAIGTAEKRFTRTEFLDKMVNLSNCRTSSKSRTAEGSCN